MKLLVLMLLAGFGALVLAFISWLKGQNTNWANGQPSYHDRFNWIGEWMEKYRNRR